MVEKLLVSAAQSDNVALAKARIEAGDIAEQGGSAGLWAGFNGNVEIARLLVDAGADLTYQDSSGNTAYTYALTRGHAAAAAVFEEGAKKLKEPPVPEKWILAGAASVAFVGNYPEIDKKLTHIFNFETRERTTVSENLKTKSEGVSPAVSFNDVAPESLEKAFGEFLRLGGAADADYVRYGANDLGKPRKPSLREPGHG